jgi:hypothetical protein
VQTQWFGDCFMAKANWFWHCRDAIVIHERVARVTA